MTAEVLDTMLNSRYGFGVREHPGTGTEGNEVTMGVTQLEGMVGGLKSFLNRTSSVDGVEVVHDKPSDCNAADAEVVHDNASGFNADFGFLLSHPT